MIFDCFTFFNELDLLEIRLNTLKNVVDRFVIAEATRTHTGKPKELIFAKNRHRFAEFEDRIVHVVVDNLLPEDEVSKDSYNLPWVNENRQRNALARGLATAVDDDIVMVSDVDEIPRPGAVLAAEERLSGNVDSIRMELSFYNFYLNFKNYSYPKWMIGTAATRYGVYREGRIFAASQTDRYTQPSENMGPTINKLRFLKADSTIRNAGWHFSFLGGIDAIQEKLAAFSHSEFAAVPREVLEERIRSGNDLFGRVGKSFGVTLDGSFPDYILRNKSRFSRLIFPVDESYLSRTKWARRRASLRGSLYRTAVAAVPQCAAPALVKLRDSVMRLFGRI